MEEIVELWGIPREEAVTQNRLDACYLSYLMVRHCYEQCNFQAQEVARQLNRDELWKFRDWFNEFLEEAWDREMEEDAEAGKLTKLADEALQEYREGRTTELGQQSAQ